MGGRTEFTDRWNDYFVNFKQSECDIYFTEEYVKLYESEQDKAECFVYKDGNNVFLFPYLKRKIALAEGSFFDFETAYGYGGPLSNTTDESFLKKAVDEFISGAKENDFVAGFVRFHPLLDNHLLLADTCKVSFMRKTVAMDLTLSAAEIWKGQIHAKHRNSIRKAEGLGLIYKVDETLEYLEEFTDLYLKTMRRIEAEEFYFFKRNYFNSMRNLSTRCFLGLVSLEDKVISSAIFFKNDDLGHYHLSGSLDEYKKYNSNNLLIYKTALYMKEKGVKRFHLGGGTDNSLGNTLYKFKKKFSRDEYSFYIGKCLFDYDKYNEICNEWGKKFPSKKDKYGSFFLRYRY